MAPKSDLRPKRRAFLGSERRSFFRLGKEPGEDPAGRKELSDFQALKEAQWLDTSQEK